MVPKLTDSFYGNEIRIWLISLAVALGILIVLRVVEQVLIVRAMKLAKKTSTIADDLVVGALRKTKNAYLLTASIFAGSLCLTLPPEVGSVLRTVMLVATLIQAGIWLSSALQIWLAKYRKEQDDGASLMTMNTLSFLGRVVLWATILLLTLDNLGVDVTALVAGLGIGGVAIALAVQNILGDLFASLSIVLDKPFVLGDFIIVGDLMGSVEHIGIKTTRIRSISGEQLIFSNGDLLSSRIRNFGRMERRRVVFKLGVIYQTTADALERIPSIIRETVEAQEKTTFDRSHFGSYGDFSLDFETVYYVESADYNLYMDIQQAINLTLYRRFADEGIEFAYPTQTLFIEKP